MHCCGYHSTLITHVSSRLAESFFKKSLFILGCAGSSLLPAGSSLVVGCGLLIEVASLVVERGLGSTWASVIAAPGH